MTVESAPRGYGVAPGKYNVLVQWPEPIDAAPADSNTKTARVQGKTVTVAKHNRLDPVPSDRLKGRHSDPDKPRLSAEIKPGPNDLGTFELSLK